MVWRDCSEGGYGADMFAVRRHSADPVDWLLVHSAAARDRVTGGRDALHPHRSVTGYLSSLTAAETGVGTAGCPWLVDAPAGMLRVDLPRRL